MMIRELNTDGGFATVTLQYDELRCIHNSLYELSQLDEIKKDPKFDTVHKRMMELFTLLKHGYIPGFELDYMYELIHKNAHSTEKGGKE